MAALAALLFVVAWNMSEARHVVHTLRSAPPGDVAILVVCFALTVLFDMVLAVGVGVGLAAALFIRRMASLTSADRVPTGQHDGLGDLPADVAVYDINGPLFFGAAEKALTSLRLVDPRVRIVILDMHDVPSMDGTAIVGLQSLIDEMQREGVGLILAGLPTRILVKLRRAGIRTSTGALARCTDLAQAAAVARRWHQARSA
jgi:SulP family sulfate permease